jgi:hypothetical protein
LTRLAALRHEPRQAAGIPKMIDRRRWPEKNLPWAVRAWVPVPSEARDPRTIAPARPADHRYSITNASGLLPVGVTLPHARLAIRHLVSPLPALGPEEPSSSVRAIRCGSDVSSMAPASSSHSDRPLRVAATARLPTQRREQQSGVSCHTATVGPQFLNQN